MEAALLLPHLHAAVSALGAVPVPSIAHKWHSSDTALGEVSINLCVVRPGTRLGGLGNGKPWCPQSLGTPVPKQEHSHITPWRCSTRWEPGMTGAPCHAVLPLHTMLPLAQPRGSYLHQDPESSPRGGCVLGWSFSALESVIQQGTGSTKAGPLLSRGDSYLSSASPLPKTKAGAAGRQSESP